VELTEENGSQQSIRVSMTTETTGAIIFFTASTTQYPPPAPTHNGAVAGQGTQIYQTPYVVPYGSRRYFRAIAYRAGMIDSVMTELAVENGGLAPGGGGGRTVTYTYTPDMLNRSTVHDTATGQTTNYAQSALNQYTSVGQVSQTYDKNFNLTAGQGFGGTYDAANRLVSATNGGWEQADFVYDGLGRCVKRTVNGVVTVLVYDEWKPIAEWDEWGYIEAWNVYGPGADEILLRHRVKVGYIRFHADANGNVAFLVDNDGRVIEKYSYDAFGKAKITDASGSQVRATSHYHHRFLFQGREYIDEAGVYDYRNRFYHPGLGRFIQKDPTGFDAGDMNLFRYCGDDPIDYSDPMGLAADIEQYRDDDPLDQSIQNVNVPRKFVYAGHGSQRPERLGQVQDPRYYRGPMGSGPVIPAAKVSQSIMASPAFRTKPQIFLMVCSSGARGSSLAKDVSAATGKAVIAPDKMLWINEKGKYFAADPKLSADGKRILGPDVTKLGNLVQFNPDGSSKVVHTYLPPKPVSHVDFTEFELDGVNGRAGISGPPFWVTKPL
jgi:RHS repeat-associated protein